MSGPLPTLYNADKNDQEIHTEPEDGNCNICQNVWQLSH
jgi:hypothetical protein